MSLSPEKRMSKLIRMTYDPVFFHEDPYFMDWKLRPAQKEIIDGFYKSGCRILVGCAGMRGGKTTVGAGMLLYETAKLLAMEDPFKHYNLLRTQPITLIGVSYKEELAMDTIHATWKSVLEESPFFREFDPRIVSKAVFFDDYDILMRIGGANTPGLIGHTDKMVMMDEIDKFKDTRGKTSGWLVYNQLSAGTENFGKEGYVYVCSSPITQKGIVMQLLEQAKTSPAMYWFHKATWEMNPDITRASLQEKFDRDPVAAARDYGAVPGPETYPFFPNRQILQVNEKRRNMLEMLFAGVPVKPNRTRYVLSADPSSKFDAMGIGLGHKESGIYVVDGLWRYQATDFKVSGTNRPATEIDAKKVAEDLKKVVKLFPVDLFVSDTWHYAELQSELRTMGVTVENHIVRRAEYVQLKNSFYEETIDICNYPFVLEELEMLESVSDTKVDHPKNGSKDVADALANVLWGLGEAQKEEKKSPVVIVRGFRR